ncbi:VpsP family polysaccharide biosynthesis protein [Pseudoalteromonas denitrificans]|uniref:Uncharacterized protein n=1 Tax=Pseudoalteromonas denitrificans DSM 6059 TaxID=1123010 RepID=A0A1I1U0V0_9GAMM|nr:VpsP family polysaccharide biosynthesis protein [Pseudoalteromonas denitrificans]SFD64486.1 hypothetical protein SAMN02745724_05073 [Pseudoalteromonas denitrificans DSM 6059]
MTQTKNAIFKYFTVGILSILCLTTLVISYSWGMANAWYFNASYYIDDWAKSGKLKNKIDYNNALAAINKAVSYDSEHPHYHHIKARIIHWGIGAGFEKKLDFSDVKILYKTSLSLREAWPDPWIDLARVNFIIEGLTDETQSYIDTALHYGPYQQSVTLGTLSLLMQGWNNLKPNQTSLFYKQLPIALNQNKLIYKTFELAKHNKLEKILCIQIKYNAELASLKKSHASRRFCK